MIIRPILEIIRLEESEVGTFGVLRVQKQVKLWTLEPPDFENEAFVSSIPAQQYIIERHVSPTYGETFRIRKVPGRKDVLFHWGNWSSNTEGCILLGKGLLLEPRGISTSKSAFDEFMGTLQGHSKAHLTIMEVF